MSKTGIEWTEATPCRLIAHVGKKRAGRLLDGIEHNAMPVRS